jgi:transposase
MQVLSDGQWAKFEAAIAAVKLRGARPRKEERRTIEAIIWRLDNGAKWRSIPAELGDWHQAYLRFRLGRSAECGTRSWPTSLPRESLNRLLPASTARLRGRIRRPLGRDQTN